MARKSRKNPSIAMCETQSSGKQYHCALYARISVETERKREADTIGNQLQLLKDYVSEQEDLTIFDIYCDDNISGVDFVRPEFSRMMNDMRDGKINCIVVKDLSRLGRNYLEAGEYIELVFPFFQCRFIAVTDRFDTRYQQADFAVQLKNLANEAYAKDISRKICSVNRNMQEQGKFTGGRAPYGYLIDPNDKHHLIIDDEAAPIVRELFEMVASGYTVRGAAVTMNEKGVPSPGRLLYNRGVTTQDKYKNAQWYMPTVRRMLSDEIYLGWMVTGKYRSTYLATGKKGMQKVPRSEWIVTKGTHEPIITEDVFNKVQAYFAQTREEHGMVARYNTKGMQNNLFKGRLFCGECGKAMFFRQKKNKHEQPEGWYYCAMHEHYNASYCSKKAVKKEDLESIVLKLIRTQIQLYSNSRQICLSLSRSTHASTRYKVYCDHIRDTKKQIERFLGLKAALYEDFRNGTLSQEDYLTMGQDYAQKADELRIFLGELEKEAKKHSPTYSISGSWVDMIEKYQQAESLTAEMVEAFIDRITLYNNGHIEVSFNFRDELEEVLYIAASRQKEAARHVI